ncbi:branched-chain amino acid aminotransferase [Paracrocinitomix mangrovi]|uniref:branched-chain amino acid aminotransferase n=1 Tax=Paracrocinitomix mangrovi TaxID=2862509 RepID=UPI001C8E189E|nr:branched-chain amino acid aminotransferase [Paracrocinitomix mangrovi]UKN02427.1 branched-chain amino acid aminotransferase [Paracrocinitomix mangrovi]
MDIGVNNIQITKTQNSKLSSVDFDNLPFGKVFTDHMFEMDYKDGKWQTPTIVPFGNLQLHPATSALHYGQAIFEGLKAQKTANGEILIFRPDMNIKRFNESAKRMCMAEVPEDLFMEALKSLIDLDREWVPSNDGQSLYIRPFMIATDDYVGIKPSDNYKFVIILSPVGAYYAEPVKVKIETHYTRAAEGGVGRAKAAGNYAASLYPAKLAQAEGFRQLVWTDAKTHEFIEEAGTMNVMFVINDVIITPDETKDTILKGITKRSVVEIAKDWGYTVEERPVTVKEVIDAINNGTLQDAFGAGTAATIAPISHIGFEGTTYELPPVEERAFSNKVKDYVSNYKLGIEADKFGWMVKV